MGKTGKKGKKFPTGKKKAAGKKAASTGGAKVWCQFDVTAKERETIMKAKKVREYKNLADYAKALILADVKKLGSKVN